MTMRSTRCVAYGLLGLTLGIILFLLWRGDKRTSRERFQSTLTGVDPPSNPCNADFGSLVQDQFLSENANRGNKQCPHQYPDPTVFGNEIRMQRGPDKFFFCTGADASNPDLKCPVDCESGCISFQSEVDSITNATAKKVTDFETSLGQFESKQFNPMKRMFEGPTANPAVPTAVHPTITNELERRDQLIMEMNSLHQQIQTATDEVAKVSKHVNAQNVCAAQLQAVSAPGMKTHYWKDGGVASQQTPKSDSTKDYDLQYTSATIDGGYSCFTQTPNSSKYAKWLDSKDTNGSFCDQIVKTSNTAGLITKDIMTKCQANQKKAQDQLKSKVSTSATPGS